MGKEEAYQRAANKYQITKKIFIFHIYFRNNLQSILITFKQDNIITMLLMLITMTNVKFPV